MPEEGFEPTWNRMSRWILSPVRLPISPLRRIIFLTLSLISVNFGIIRNELHHKLVPEKAAAEKQLRCFPVRIRPFTKRFKEMS